MGARSAMGRDSSRRTGAATPPAPGGEGDNGNFETVQSGALDPDVTTSYIDLAGAGATVLTLAAGSRDGQLKVVTNDALNVAATSCRINGEGGIRRGASGSGGSGYVQVNIADPADWFGAFCVLRWSVDADMWLFQYGVGFAWQEES